MPLVDYDAEVIHKASKPKAGDSCQGNLGEGGILIDINHESLPDALRSMANDYAPPARFVVKQGDGEYGLFSEEGEELDLVWDCY